MKQRLWHRLWLLTVDWVPNRINCWVTNRWYDSIDRDRARNRKRR